MKYTFIAQDGERVLVLNNAKSKMPNGALYQLVLIHKSDKLFFSECVYGDTVEMQ